MAQVVQFELRHYPDRRYPENSQNPNVEQEPSSPQISARR